MSDDPKLRKEKAIKSIRENYKQLEQSIVKQLFMSNDLHGTTTGTFREEIWKGLFEMVIPKKFVIEQSVFIIDSHGEISHEVDLAIMDEMYTPYIFRYGKIKFIPIEAVAAVVECKSKNPKSEELQGWMESIASLKTSGESIARMAMSIATHAVGTQQSTRPIRILCTLGETCKEINKMFDFTLEAHKDEKGEKEHMVESFLQIIIPGNGKSLFEWYKELNFHQEEDNCFKDAEKALEDLNLEKNYQVCDAFGSSISLMSFNFQLNQLLMLINNPLLFPHQDYVKLFNQK